MKKLNKTISILLMILLIVSSTFQIKFTVYAEESNHGGSGSAHISSKERLKDILDNTETYLLFLCSQMGAIADGSFIQMYQNYKDYVGLGIDDYWNEDNIQIDDDGNIVFSDDLIKCIKQALKEYQNEQYGYQILPTLKYDQIPVSNYNSAVEYRTMCELVKTYKIISTPYYGGLQPGDVTPYIDGTAGFYITSYYTDNVPEVRLMDFTTWENVKTIYANGFIEPLKETVSTFEDLVPLCNYTGYYCRYSLVTTNTSNKYVWGNCANYLVSYTGCDVLVFNNATSLKNYSVDKRGVFTTAGFYEDTGELTLKLDDLNNSIGDLTDLLSQFKDLLGKQEGGLTEEQLQHLLQQFLDDFFERLGDQDGDDDGGGNSSGGGSSGGISESFQRTIEGYFEGVLSYLDSILYEIQNLEFITAESSVDSEHSDLSDMFDLIWQDPENNTQVVADELSQSFGDIAGSITKKFPFSIPWDVYGLFTVLADVDPPQAASTYSLLSNDSDYAISGSDTYEMDVAVYSRDSNGNEHSAPYFELPIILERYGIEEYIIVDLQYFQPISTLSRTMLSLLFGVFLMKFTIKVIDLFKGGTDS